jgi:hypothetical protein
LEPATQRRDSRPVGPDLRSRDRHDEEPEILRQLGAGEATHLYEARRFAKPHEEQLYEVTSEQSGGLPTGPILVKVSVQFGDCDGKVPNCLPMEAIGTTPFTSIGLSKRCQMEVESIPISSYGNLS